MSWIYLGIAAVFEVIFAMGMKYSSGFTNTAATAVTGVAVIGGIFFLSLAMKTLPVSVAYPVWTAIGVLGTVVLGYLFLGEGVTFLKIASTIAIVAGVAGLRATVA